MDKTNDRVRSIPWGNGGTCKKAIIGFEHVLLFRKGVGTSTKDQRSPVGYSDEQLLAIAKDVLQKCKQNCQNGSENGAAGVIPVSGVLHGVYTRDKNTLVIFLRDYGR